MAAKLKKTDAHIATWISHHTRNASTISRKTALISKLIVICATKEWQEISFKDITATWRRIHIERSWNNLTMNTWFKRKSIKKCMGNWNLWKINSKRNHMVIVKKDKSCSTLFLSLKSHQTIATCSRMNTYWTTRGEKMHMLSAHKGLPFSCLSIKSTITHALSAHLNH